MATQRPQQSSLAPFIALAGVGAAGVAVAYQYPGVAALWVVLLIAAWMEPQAIVTGAKINGRPTPLDEREKKGQQTYQVWKNLQTGLLMPAGIIPGWPVYWSWISGLAAAGVAALLPVSDPWYRLANAVAAFIIVAQVAASLRTAKASPGTRLDSYKKAAGEKLIPLIGLTIAGTGAGALIGYIAARAWRYAPDTLQQMPATAWIAGSALLGLVTASGLIPHKIAHEHWREIVAARKDWDPRWESLKIIPGPTLVDVATVGTAQLFSFSVGGDATPYIEQRRAGQVSALIGGGIRMAALTCPNEHNGQPVAGTIHPNKFQIAVWPADQLPDLFSADTDDASRLLGVRADYQTRWDNLKIIPAPVATGSQLVGPARVDTFTAGHAGASMYWPLVPKIAITFPGVTAMAVIPTIEPDGQRSQQTFSIVSWTGELPDITDPTIDDDVARLAIETSIIRVCEDARYGVPVLAAADRITKDEDPLTWEVRLDFPDGPTMLDLRTGGQGAMAAQMLSAECVVDHRDGEGYGVMWMGALEPSTLPRDIARRIDEEVEEDRFRTVWAQSLKMNMSAPRPQPKLKQSRSLLPEDPPEQGRRSPARPSEDGPKVTRYAFGIPQGVDPDLYFGYEERIKTAFFPTTFLATTGFNENTKGRPGDRAQRLLVMYHSADPIPASPDLLAPCKAAEWVLSGMVNAAFKAARLIQPEVVANKSRCLTVPGARGHIWRVVVRLYGGNTLTDVRAVRTRLANGFGSPWLRVTSGDEDGLVVFYVGADPKKAKLARPTQDKLDVDSRDWEQAFIDAGATGSGAVLPALTATGVMPHNDKVMVLEFGLPSGLDVPTIKNALPKLRASTGNEFIEVRSGKGGASTITVLASVDDPMPTMAGYDYDTAMESTAIPFATGVDGEPITYDWRNSAHLLVAGATGAGKAQPEGSCVPVPLSDRFPSGIARWEDLEVGDPLLGVDGQTPRITETHAWQDQPMFEVVFDTGQTSIVGANHLWRVSNGPSRAAHSANNNDRRAWFTARRTPLTDQATRIREQAEGLTSATFATVAEIEEMAGIPACSLYRFDLDGLVEPTVISMGRPCSTVDGEQVWRHLADREMRTGRACTLGGTPVPFGNLGHLNDLVVHSSGWLTARQVADCLMGGRATRRQMHGIKSLIQHNSIPVRAGDGEATTTVWSLPAKEVLLMVADDLDNRALLGNNKRELMPLEVVLNTKTLVARGIAPGSNIGDRSFAVRCPAPVALPAADLPIDPYVLGVWLGDGSAHKGAITTMDDEIVQSVERAGYPFHRFEEGHNGLAKTYFSNELTRAIRLLYSSTGTRKAIKRIPATYLRSSADQRLAVLQGIVDTDGSIALDGQCEITLSDLDLATDTLELVRSLGIKASMRTGSAGYRNADGVFVPCKDRHRILFTTSLPVCRLTRKAERLHSVTGLTGDWLYIVDIRTAGTRRGRCITVDAPMGGYMTDGFVPTHNSALLQQLITGAILRGAELFIIDPTKGAADFRFAEPWASCVAVELHEAAAAMKGVYQEVLRRKTLNSQYGVGSYRDLPEEVRPRHIVLVIDEFTSMMGPDPVSKTPFDDPDAEAERQATVLTNNAKILIGTFTGKIGREARSAGVTLILATQKLSADMLNKLPGASDLKSNLARILLGNTTYGDRQSALRMPDSAPELGTTIPIGRGYFESSVSAPVAMQVWYDTPDKLGTFLAAHVAPTQETFDTTPYLVKQTEHGPAVSDVSLDGEFDMDEFVDLGELELDLDDLADDGSGEPFEEAPAADTDWDEPTGDTDVEEGPEPVTPEADEIPQPAPDVPVTGPAVEPETPVSAPSSPWDRPWGVAEPVPVAVHPTPLWVPQTPTEPEPAKRSHQRAPMFAVDDF